MVLLRKLREHGSGALFAFFTVLAVVCMIVPFSLGTASLGNEGQGRLSDASVLTAQAISTEIDSLSALLKTYSTDNRLTQAEPGLPGDVDWAPRQAMESLKSSSPFVTSAAYFGIDGTMLVDAPLDANVNKNFAYRAYFKEALAQPSDIYVSTAFESVLSGQPTLVVLALAVRGADNAPVGVVVVGLDVEKTLQPLVSTNTTDYAGTSAIYDWSGSLVVGSAAPGTDQQAFKEAFSGALGGMSPRINVTDDEGNKHLVALTPSSDRAFVVVTSAEESMTLGPVKEFQHRMVGVLGTAGVAMLLSIFFLARSFRARDHALTEVRRQAERTRMIVDSAGQAFVETDLDGIVTEWNVSAVKMFGWTQEEAIGRDLHMLVAPDWRLEDSRREATEWQSGKRTPTGDVVRAERPVVRRGGKEPFPVSMTAWLRDSDGDLRMSFFLEDITERRQLEAARELVFRRQRELVEELRTADQTKNDFISTISHELRTPLTSITGYVEMLQDGYGGDLGKSGKTMVDVIDRNARRLLTLIEDLLTLSRIESGQEKTLTSLVNMRHLAFSVRDALVPQTTDRHIDLLVDIPEDLPDVEGDSNQLERVLLNLLSNAVKFTPDGGSVTMRSWQDAESVRFEVKDTGIGIPLDEQHRLFSKFFRSTTARDKQIQGTGLGLTIVKSIVERHGGTISISSLPDVGTTVMITIPAVAPALVSH